MNVSRAVLTLWYVNAADPAAVLRAEPKADRGFGRKFLAQLNPSLPVTPIGQFPLNRSAQADVGEYYIGGYPGVTVVQTVITGAELKLSQLSPLLLHAVSAADIYAFAANESEHYAGVAHWQDGRLKRSLCSTATEFVEDTGLPEPFEGPFWAGEHALPDTGAALSLPFDPLELLREAERYWLGVDVDESGPDLDVVGYAVDGRPEPKVAPAPRVRTASQAASAAAAKLGLGPANGDYDDYAAPDKDPGPTLDPAAGDAARTAVVSALDAARAAGSHLNGALHTGWRYARVGLGTAGAGLAGLAARVQDGALSLIKRDRR